VQCSNRVAALALGHHIACAAFALAALGGHAQFKLDFVKAHARTNVASDFTVRDPAADTDDHGSQWWIK
jgi:hypothetical protein